MEESVGGLGVDVFRLFPDCLRVSVPSASLEVTEKGGEGCGALTVQHVVTKVEQRKRFLW